MSEAQANGRQRPVLVEDDTLQDAGAQYELDEGIIRINPAILEEEATQFEDRIDRRRMIDAIIDEELIHWHLAQSYQQPSAAEIEEAYEAMMERFVSEYPHVLLEAYRTYTKSHSPDLKPISLEEFMSDEVKVAEAFDEFVRQIVQLQTTGRITEEVSHPWPERDLGPSGWLGKYRDSLEHSYRMALGGHWGEEMQAIVEQAEARARTAVETYELDEAPLESISNTFGRELPMATEEDWSYLEQNLTELSGNGIEFWSMRTALWTNSGAGGMAGFVNNEEFGVFFRFNSRRLTIYHELYHARQATRLGRERYDGQSRYVAEAFVYIGLMENETWLTEDERFVAWATFRVYEELWGPRSFFHQKGISNFIQLREAYPTDIEGTPHWKIVYGLHSNNAISVVKKVTNLDKDED